ncbi:bifunctional diguanylate cyclase/phosphodiesterase [Thiomicrospira sp. WB1]|uniref:putative bifunctional diguanylate cyclase/phosphodiesterase n=1 Tax=Thiomicrospira sp. WB1 TaxID=1685380 RepID=UPI0007488595|nr:EAL domain-containing protein [Thiomicrospira sp. WB1]KUJ72515.1 diguanylate cyclase [Thiomicrospira sp. WB1]
MIFNLQPRVFIRFLIASYLIIMLLVAGAFGLFFYFEKKIQTAFDAYIVSTTNQNHIETLMSGATQRSVLMTKMVHAKDIFRVDELHMKMLEQEQRIIKSLMALRSELHKQSTAQKLNQVAEVMTQTRSVQESVFQQLMQGSREQAFDTLVEKVLPAQDQVYSRVTELKQIFARQALAAQTDFSDQVSAFRQMSLLTALPTLVVLILVGGLSVVRIRRYAQAREELLATLEQRVEARTHELMLDRNLMQNLNEAIGIFDQAGHLQISNKPLTRIRQSLPLQDLQSVWEMLKKGFGGLDVAQVQEALRMHHKWRGEAALSTGAQGYYMIDMAQLDDPSLPQPYFSLILTEITELKQIQNQLTLTAKYDAITQLPNRHHFNHQIEHRIHESPDEPFHLFYLDLNDFKWVNDHLGHAAGDAFLQAVGQAFKRHLSGEAFIARIGGDEFAVIVPGSLSKDRLCQLAEQFLATIAAINLEQNTGHDVGCSIGVSHFPEHGQTPEALLKKADYAMYFAKSSDDARHCAVFDESMEAALQHQSELEVNLHDAVKSQAFTLHYQAQFKLSDLSLSGAEALIRWPSEEGMVSPAEFIPMAEKFGLIDRIGEFVLEAASTQLQAWQKTPLALPKMAINTSCSQLLSPNFHEQVMAVLAHHRLQPAQLDIEVTESVMMRNIEHHSFDNETTSLQQLQSAGVEISIDDFGTGYSSLAYIKHLNIDRIKIDKRFVEDLDQNPESRSIVGAIITMGHSLGLRVLAEGIETQSQLDQLRQLGCDEGQGFFLSRPVAAETFAAQHLQSQDKEA